MTFLRFFVLFFSVALIAACTPQQPIEGGSSLKVEGFDYQNSDNEAIRIAEEVLEVMGGKKQWKKARYFVWTFFDERKHFWDKNTGNIRIESLTDSLLIVMNVNTSEGKVFIGKEEISNPDSLKKYLERGKKTWADDSYWLVMPFKLIDKGVTLKYLGTKGNYLDVPCDVLEVTYKQGSPNTLGERFEIYVDKTERMVTQWAFYHKTSDLSPSMICPWTDYEKYHNIWLSSGRGNGELSDIYVLDTLPLYAFNTSDMVVVSDFIR
ncbi:MAG: hypothetical protein COA57_13770 [Flavobacteriales bacterium]|nr:MAG: hypothetical protein COA57_13770 [Flavobacteriales bacterium]